MEGKLFSYIKYNLFQYFKFKGVLDPKISYKEFKNEYYQKDRLGELEEKKPTLKELVEMTKIPDKTMRTLLNAMIEKEIIDEMTGYGRNKLFIFDKYLRLF
jgi:Fic family protein